MIDLEAFQKEKRRKMKEMDECLEGDLFIIGYIAPRDDTGLLNYDDFDRIYRII